MTSRRLIRIKVLQLLYAYSKRENISIAETENDLLHSIQKSTELYHFILLLFSDIRHIAYLKIDGKRHKITANEEEKKPNTKFIENTVFELFEKNRKLQAELKAEGITWVKNPEIIEHFYSRIIESPIYEKYMNHSEKSFEEDKELIIDIFKNIITQDDIFFETMEDNNIYWNDDFELVFNVIYKTLKNLKADFNEESNFMYDVFSSLDDVQFAKKLLRSTLLNNDDTLKLIDKFTKNWEIERISDMDKIILSEAINEILTFPSIPVKVSFDEYIEIAKNYSSAKSSAFINGILDKIVINLKEENRINKAGRGLV